VRSKSGGWGEWCFQGKEMVQQDLVHLLRGLSPWEGGEVGWGTAVGEPLGRP